MYYWSTLYLIGDPTLQYDPITYLFNKATSTVYITEYIPKACDVY